MDYRTILIVDEDPHSARALDALLGKLGFVVSGIASSQDEAMPMLERARLVLLNVAPGRDSTNIRTSALLTQRISAVLLIVPESVVPEMKLDSSRSPIGLIARPFTDRELRVHIDLALCRFDSTRALHEIEDRFFSTSIDMLCFLGFDGHFKRLNSAWEHTLGFTRDELMSRPFIEFVHPDDREGTLEQNRKVRSGGKALAFMNRYLCKDGSYRWFLWNAAPDSPEQLIYSMARDVTASKNAAHEREQLVRELQSALDEVKALRGILPMCSYCRKIRDDNDYWHTVESYISTHTTTLFTHGICPTCEVTEIEPQFAS